MATGHLSDTCGASLDLRPPGTGWSRPASVGLAHLGVMDTTHPTHTRPDAVEPVFTIAGLATELSAPIGANPRSRSRGTAAFCFHVPNGTVAHELE